MEDSWIISALKEVGNFIVTEGLWPPVKCHVDYWWSLGDNIQGLRDEICFLEREMRDMDQRVEEARLRAESATADVQNWSNEGTRKLEEATRILRRHNDLKIWNIISQYSVGKNAKRSAEDLEKLRKDGNSIVCTYPAPPPSMVLPISDEPSMEFESRRHVEEEIMKSLSDDHVHVIAICGAGGVGKTTMAWRIADRVIIDNLFDEVVMVVVSQQIEMLKIQEEIAELLGLSLSENTLVGRAVRLRTRLLDSKRKLIIFDDVWESFKLGAIGVPLGNSFTKGKIILTSRVKDACVRMNAQKIIPMETLTKEEAWTLFKEKAGCCVEGLDLLPVAKQIVEECKGLPVSLVTVGKALKDQSMHVWRDSLSQLSRSIPIDFPEVIKEVYKPLKLSYDFLENESMKSLFELCSLFPEDYNISIECLTWYSIGLGILEDIKNIQEGINRVYSFVEKLKSRFLLISGSWGHVKMHDVVRDVAIFICSKEKHGWLKSIEASSMNSSSKDSSCNCNWMSIDISIENANLPVLSNFPNLRLLMLLDSAYSENSNVICFRGIEELYVLYFSRLNHRSFPPSLNLLKKLRTLILVSCEVEDISLVGELASLEILCVHFCGNIKELPIYVGRLNHLKVLELKSCRRLKRIASGVISSLVGLEELKIINCFDKWEPKENQSEERNVSLSELECLPNLTFLDIHISNCNLVAQEICLSQQLVRYRIASSDNAWRHFGKVKHERNIALTLQGDVTVGNWIRQLLKRTQSLVLRGDGSNNFNLSETESLRYLILVDCSRMKKVVNSSDCKFLELEHLELQNLEKLEEIIDGIIPEKSNSFQKLESLNLCNLPKLVHLWKSLNQNVSGGNLKSISIENCPNLRYVLSATTARSLVQLQDLKILHCDTIEQVLWNEVGSNTHAFVIELPTLKELILFSLPNLTTFSHGVDIIECPQLTKVQIMSCPMLKTRIGKCPKLRDIRLSAFNDLDHILSSCVTKKWNTQLQAIEICDCDSVKEISWGEIKDAGNGHIIFSELKKLGLSDLPCFTTFYRGVDSIKFLKLEELTIRNLPMLNSLAPMDSEPSHDDHSLHFFCNQKVEFSCLRELRLEDLRDIRSNIWCRNVPVSFFHNLDRLGIFRINGIKNFMSSSIAKHLVNLEYLWIKSCPDMVEVIEDENEVPAVSLFPKLQVLNIQSLHKLRSFCQWKHAFELPSLIIVVINDCPRIETFTLGSPSTPILRTFKINNQMVETKDLNAGIHDHFTTEEETGNWSARSSKRQRT